MGADFSGEVWICSALCISGRPPADLRRDLTAGPGPVLQRAGREVVILPRHAVLDLLEQTRSAPFADGRVLDELAARVMELADLDPSGPVLHGDFYLGNVLVDEGEVSALIDFEFARTGPLDLEAISVIRALDAEKRAGVSRPPLLDWLREDYPPALAHPDLPHRLWLYAISTRSARPCSGRPIAPKRRSRP